MKLVLDRGAHWRNLANTIESSVSGADATFLPNYFDQLLWSPNRQAIIFCSCGFFVLSLFYPRLFSAVADWMSTIGYFTHDVALVRI